MKFGAGINLKQLRPDALEPAVADVFKAAGEVEGEVEEEDEAQVVEVNQADLEAAAWPILLLELQLMVVLDTQTHQQMKGLVRFVKYMKRRSPKHQEYIHGNIQVTPVVTPQKARVSLHQASSNVHDVHQNQQESN